jgi:hypothetical protein
LHRDCLIGESELCDLHHTLDRLLNDDDEELRDGASDIVRKALGVASPICRDKADELWCEWVRAHMSALGPEDRQVWIHWLPRGNDEKDMQNTPKDGSKLSTLSPLTPFHTDGHATLFTVEPSNLFRDPVTDTLRVTRLL